MNKNLQSPTKLTEFAPLQSEEKQQGVGQFISKFFKLSRSTPTEPSVLEASEDSSRDISPAREVCSGTKDAIYPVDVTEERSLPNVLKRISNLLALKTNVCYVHYQLIFKCICVFFFCVSYRTYKLIVIQN